MTSIVRPVYGLVKAALPSGGSSWAVVGADGAFHDAATDWLGSLQDAGSPVNTVKSYGRKVAAYLSWLAGLGLPWHSPTLTVLTQWLGTVREFRHETGPKRGQPVSEATVAVYKAAVLNFYRWAVAAGEVDAGAVSLFYEWQRLPAHAAGELPTQRLVSARSLKVSVPEKAPVWIESREDLDRLLGVKMNLRDWVLVTLLFATGMRVGEALSLFRADMHLTASSTMLSCNRPGPHVHIHDGNEVLNGAAVKDKRGRVVPVPVWWVQAYADYQRERFDILGVDENPHVFVNLYGRNRGGAMTDDTARALLERLSRETGLDVTPHTFRHTRASWWLLGVDGEKVDARTVQELLGHASLKTTDVYTHTREKERREAVESVTALLRGGGVEEVTA